ncbi:hypothetical protein BH24ACT26_BH24ACT26_18680 [soil metagenome]
MTLYAEVPSLRLRQIAADALVAAWIAAWVRIGLWVDELVNRLAGPGRALERAGAGLARPLRDAGREVAEIPVVGDALQSPLESAASAAGDFAGVGASQQDVVHSLAVTLGLLFAVLPILVALLVYLPGRLRWVREATAASRLRLDSDDLELFALRALATRPLSELRRATPDPAAAFRAGDHAALAALELQALGLGGPRRVREVG